MKAKRNGVTMSVVIGDRNKIKRLWDVVWVDKRRWFIFFGSSNSKNSDIRSIRCSGPVWCPHWEYISKLYTRMKKIMESIFRIIYYPDTVLLAGNSQNWNEALKISDILLLRHLQSNHLLQVRIQHEIRIGTLSASSTQSCCQNRVRNTKTTR